MDMRRIIVVGLGSIGRRHARLLSARTDLRVEAVEPDDESLARARSEIGEMHIYPSFEAAVATRPEMVLIATPPCLHADQTIAALAAGCHVLCEKPMCDNLADAKRMQKAAESADKVVSIGFSGHFSPPVIRLRELMQNGELGQLVYAHLHVGTYLTLVLSLSRHQAELEGAVMLDYAHQPDFLFWALSRNPRGVYVAGEQAGRQELQSNPNVVSLTCDYEDPLITSIHLNFVQAPAQARYEVIGDQGWAALDLETGQLRIGSGGHEGSIREEMFPQPRDAIYQAEHQTFMDAVDGKCQTESPVNEAIQSMYVIDAAMRSWKSGQRVVLDKS